MGKIIFRYGTMGAGKSTFLLTTADNLERNCIPFIIIKPSIDDRDGVGVIHSRKIGDKECIPIDSDINPFDFIRRIVHHEVENGEPHLRWVLVDEAQFLTAEQVDGLAKAADEYGLLVACYGLRTDFKTHLFEGSKRLFEIADTFEELKAPCSCGKKTIYNAKVDTNGNIVTEGESIEIGESQYVSVCRSCYNKRLTNK